MAHGVPKDRTGSQDRPPPGEGILVDGTSGAVVGMVGGALFQGCLDSAPRPEGAWASLRYGSADTRRGMHHRAHAAEPVRPLAPASGFASAWSGSVPGHMLEGEDFEDAASDSITDAEIGAITGTLSTSAARCIGPRGAEGREPSSWLSFCLIHPRPRAFTADRRQHVRAGHARSRPAADSRAQSSKACDGQPLRGFKSHLHRH